MLPDKKVCGWCNVEKPASCFQVRRKNGREWLRLECKECNSEKRREDYAANDKKRAKILERNKAYAEKNDRREYWKEYEIKNKERKTTNGRARYSVNADKIKLKRKEYYYDNKAKVIALNNDYVERNKSKVRERQRRRHANRKKQDIGYAIMKVLRSRMGMAIKNKGKKCAKTAELVGCSMIELTSHLEGQFKDGMGWDNYGYYGWHIDHIIPCAKFDLSKPEEQKRCFHWSNLQPLWGIDNIKKGARI